MWFEEAKDASDGQWSLSQYGLTARHLGQFNGSFLVQQIAPEFP